MITDTQKLEWIAESMLSFSIEICCTKAHMTYIDHEGYRKSISVSSEDTCSSPIELLNLALKTAMK